MNFERRTIAKSLEWSGPGLHSGEPCVVRLHPNSSGMWIRSAAGHQPISPQGVTDTSRCTKLFDVNTVEHLMSALSGCEITDFEIEVEGAELPAAGGSALQYAQAIQEAGYEVVGSLTVEGPFARVYEKGDDHSIAMGKGEGHFRYVFDTGERWPQIQDFELFLDADRYQREIAPARTFCFEEELEWIQTHGLGKGLDADSALVLATDGYKNSALFPDEPARHKLLDLIGDLYLTGIPYKALNVVGEKSGHRANIQAAIKLAEHVKITRD